MKDLIKSLVFSIVAVVIVSISLVSVAQQRGGGGMGFDPSRMRDMMLSGIQQQLQIADADWEAIKPLVEKVMEHQQSNMRPPFMMMRRPGGNQGQGQGQAPGGNRPRRPRFGGEPDPAETALEKALASETTSIDDIKAKMTSLRKARANKAADLKKAREDLRSVLTVRQEAQLVLSGFLD
jgi:Spy/CpxP family protein refolding chaperone